MCKEKRKLINKWFLGEHMIIPIVLAILVILSQLLELKIHIFYIFFTIVAIIIKVMYLYEGYCNDLKNITCVNHKTTLERL